MYVCSVCVLFATSPKLLSNAKLCRLIEASMIQSLWDSSVYKQRMQAG